MSCLSKDIFWGDTLFYNTIYITISYWIRSWRWWKLITVGDNETFRTTDRHVNSLNDKYICWFLIISSSYTLRSENRGAKRRGKVSFFQELSYFGALVFKRHNWNAQNEFWIFAPKIKHKKIRIIFGFKIQNLYFSFIQKLRIFLAPKF